MASVIFSSRCEPTFLPNGAIEKVTTRVRPFAKMRPPTSSKAKIEFIFDTGWPERTPEERGAWGYYGEPNFLNEVSRPLGPSLIRNKTEIGVQRKGRIGELEFPNCQDFLLDTDFGKQRTIECNGVGLVAEDHYLRRQFQFYPHERIVAIESFPWDEEKYNDKGKRKQYYDEIIAGLSTLARKHDFFKSCQIDFLDILRP